MRIKAAYWALMVCLLVPIEAAAQTYFSMGSEIRRLGSAQPVWTGLAFVGDLALCSDNYLYFVQKSPADAISRINLSAPTSAAETVFLASGVREIRLTQDCDVLYATAAGIFKVNGRPPFSTTATGQPAGSPVTLTNGSGLAVAFDGTPRFTNSANVVGLNVANGGDGSAIPILPIGALCRSQENKVICTKKDGLELGVLGTGLAPGVLAQLAAVDKVQFCEFLTNDTMYCAASVNPDAEIKLDKKAGIVHNGTVQLISAAGVVSEVFAAPTKNNVALPIAGIAVGPSSSVTVRTASASTVHEAKFGPVAAKVETPNECKLDITFRQLSRADAQSRVNSVSGVTQYSPDPGLGGESWIESVVVTPAPGPACGVSAASPARFWIFQYNDHTLNRAVLRCSSPNACKVETESDFPYSLPDDAANTSLPDDFSDFLTARISPPTNPILNQILLSAPLDNQSIVTGAIDDEIVFATTHTATGGLAVKFRTCKPGTNCAEFISGETPNPPFSGAGFAVTRLTDTGVPIGDCDLDDNGGANPLRPVFRSSDGGLTHVFNLNTPLGGPASCQLTDVAKGQSGLFVGTIFFHAGSGQKTSFLFRLVK